MQNNLSKPVSQMKQSERLKVQNLRAIFDLCVPSMPAGGMAAGMQAQQSSIIHPDEEEKQPAGSGGDMIIDSSSGMGGF